MPLRSAPLPGPAPVTKNVIFGASGNCGGTGWCCALIPDVTPSASAAIISAFDLLISVPPTGLLISSLNSHFLLPQAQEQVVHPSYSVKSGHGFSTRATGNDH